MIRFYKLIPENRRFYTSLLKGFISNVFNINNLEEPFTSKVINPEKVIYYNNQCLG